MSLKAEGALSNSVLLGNEINNHKPTAENMSYTIYVMLPMIINWQTPVCRVWQMCPEFFSFLPHISHISHMWITFTCRRPCQVLPYSADWYRDMWQNGYNLLGDKWLTSFIFLVGGKNFPSGNWLTIKINFENIKTKQLILQKKKITKQNIKCHQKL